MALLRAALLKFAVARGPQETERHVTTRWPDPVVEVSQIDAGALPHSTQGCLPECPAAPPML
jgi:hypothetical protein